MYDSVIQLIEKAKADSLANRYASILNIDYKKAASIAVKSFNSITYKK